MHFHSCRHATHAVLPAPPPVAQIQSGDKMLKIISAFNFRKDKPYEECRRYWLEEHRKVVESNLPECRRYVQNIAVPISGRSWPFDGFAEIWFDDMAAIRRSFEGPLAEQLRQDELVFSLGGDKSSWVIVNEDPVFDR